MSYDDNPFPAGDPDRHQIWEMLVARDSEAFAAQNWKMVENDFIAERFEGISGNGSGNPVVSGITLEDSVDPRCPLGRKTSRLIRGQRGTTDKRGRKEAD